MTTASFIRRLDAAQQAMKSARAIRPGCSEAYDRQTVNLLCDLRLFCRIYGIDFEACSRIAAESVNAEFAAPGAP
jgi:hypothetical protein